MTAVHPRPLWRIDWIGLALIVGLALVWRLGNLGVVLFQYDEAENSADARFWSGFSPVPKGTGQHILID